MFIVQRATCQTVSNNTINLEVTFKRFKYYLTGNRSPG